MGSVDKLEDLALKPKRNNDSYYVDNQLDTKGNPYIYRYDVELDEWINTKQVVYKDVVTQSDIVGNINQQTNVVPNSNTVYKITGVIDIDRLQSVELGYHTRFSARTAEPTAYRKKGVIIRYRQVFGIVTERYIGENSAYSHSNLLWVRDDNISFISQNSSIIVSNGNVSGWSNDSNISNYIAISSDITLEKVFVPNANGKNYACVFDSNLIYLGNLSDDNIVSGYNESISITASAVTVLYPTASFIVCNYATNKGFIAYKADGTIPTIRTSSNVRESFRNSAITYYSEVGYYMNKNTGNRSLSDGYKVSLILRLVDKENLIVSGYSGVNN